MGVNNLDQLRYKGGTFGDAKNDSVTVGTTPVGLAVHPTGELRAHWMEVHCVSSSATGGLTRDGLVWNFDTAPATRGAFLPVGNIIPYPVSPGANTLLLAAAVNTLRVDVNWYRARPQD